MPLFAALRKASLAMPARARVPRRITNTASGTVTYARTSGMTKMTVAPGVRSSVTFVLPAGPSTLVTVASGLASAPVSVTISG